MYRSSLFSNVSQSIKRKTRNAYFASLLDDYAMKKQSKKAIQLAKKKGDSIIIYSLLQKTILPSLRRTIPQRVYKYFPLDINEYIDKRNIETIMNNKIWSSTCKGFNDPFEGQYMFLSPSDFKDMGLPEQAAKTWESVIDVVMKYVTTICFTQNPNNMPMWAHYANNHHGFCVEYEIIRTDHFYPVIYIDKRLKTKNLFLDLIYYLLRENSTPEEKALVLKHVMILSTFKHRDWEYEKEIRAVFMNSIEQVPNNGRLLNCDEIGIKPLKIFSGVNCSEQNQTSLQKIAENIGIFYQKCSITSHESFNVVNEVHHA